MKKTMMSRTGFALLTLGIPAYGQTAAATAVATATAAYSGR